MSYVKERDGVRYVRGETRTASDIIKFFRSKLEEAQRTSEGEWIIQMVQEQLPWKSGDLDKLRDILRNEQPQLFHRSVDIESLKNRNSIERLPSNVLAPLSSIDRWADRKTGNKEKAVDFLRRVYSERLAEPNLRAELKETDPALYNALAQHIHRNGVPNDLQAFFEEKGNRKRTANEVELDRLGISDPNDARKLVDNPREAERLYVAAKRRK